MSVEADNVAHSEARLQGLGTTRKARAPICWMLVFAQGCAVHIAGRRGRGSRVHIEPQRERRSFSTYLDGLTRDWEMIFYRIDDYIAQGDRVVAIGSTSWRNKKTRKIVTTPKVDIWRMKNGKAVEFSEYLRHGKADRRGSALMRVRHSASGRSLLDLPQQATADRWVEARDSLPPSLAAA